MTLVGGGPLRRGWISPARLIGAGIFVFAAVVCVVHAQWSAASLAFLIAAAFLPNYRKLVKRLL